MSEWSGKYRILFIYAALAVAALAVFWQVNAFKFIDYDDPVYVNKNNHISSGLTVDNVIWVFTKEHVGNWHPLTGLSHILDCQLFGLNPGRHHIVSLLFHIANTLLLFSVLRRMTEALWQSAFVAAVFAIHPIHVESVVWISERKDVLSTLFWILTMAAYFRYTQNPKTGTYILTLVFFALGLMAKPMLVTLPFVLLLLDYWPLNRLEIDYAGRINWRILRRLIWEKIPFFVLSAVSSIVTFLFQKGAGAVCKIDALPITVRAANAIVSYVKYIVMMFLPRHLAVFYPHPKDKLSSLQVLGAAVLLVIITICVIHFAAKYRYLLAGWLWYLGTLVPVIGLVQVGDQAIADRYTYVPIIGLFIIIAWGANDLLERWKYKKIILSLSALVIVFALSVCAWFQTAYWRNSTSLFEHALKVTKGNYLAHNVLGDLLMEQDKFDEAINLFHRAMQLKPNYAEALNKLGFAYGKLGRSQEAVEACSKAIKIRPNYAEAYNNLGVAYSKLGRSNEEIEAYTQAIKIKPDLADACTNLGYALVRQNKFSQAVPYLKQAVQFEPDSPTANASLVIALLHEGKVEEASTFFGNALRIKSEHPDLMNNLAWIAAAYKGNAFYNPQQAVQLAERACELTDYKDAGILDTLAVAYAATNRFPDAIDTAQKALKIAQSAGDNQMIDQIQQRLDLFKKNQPYVETNRK